MKIGHLTICYLTQLVTYEDGSTKRYYLTKQQNCWTSGGCRVPVRRFYQEDHAKSAKEYFEDWDKGGPFNKFKVKKDVNYVYEIVSECPFDDTSDLVAELQRMANTPGNEEITE